MEQYTPEEFMSFMEAMKKMADILHSKKPNFIFAPIIGSVPLVDTLSIIDRRFYSDNVEYPPNSSRFINREEIINKWYSNFLKINYIGDSISIVCIDEVISGSSATKGYQEFIKAIREKGDRTIEKKVKYEILGIGEKPKNGIRNHNFVKLVNKKKAKVLETDKIITADNIALNPIRLKLGKINPQGRQTYLPEIESMNYPQEYLSFLYNVATYCGVDPQQVGTTNILRIQQSLERYLL